MKSIEKVSRRFMFKQAGAIQEIMAIRVGLQNADRIVEELESNLLIVEDLMAKGEQRRLGRVQGIGVGNILIKDHKVTAQVKGETGLYSVRITLAPKRGHHCTCPDWEQNGLKVGPCKHVLALGAAWKKRLLDPELDEIGINVQAMMAAYT